MRSCELLLFLREVFVLRVAPMESDVFSLHAVVNQLFHGSDHQERAIRLIDVACFCDFLQQSLELDLVEHRTVPPAGPFAQRRHASCANDVVRATLYASRIPDIGERRRCILTETADSCR